MKDATKEWILHVFILMVFSSLFIYSFSTSVYANAINDSDEATCASNISCDLGVGNCWDDPLNLQWDWASQLDTFVDGQYNPGCCGDDTEENIAWYDMFYPTNSCDDESIEACVGRGDDTSDVMCCRSSTDCVYQGLCYPVGTGYADSIDLDGDGVYGEFCYNDGGNGKWQDCDADIASCEAAKCGNKKWLQEGVGAAFGEWDLTDLGDTECCGDDAGEMNRSRIIPDDTNFTISSSASDARCCDAGSDCVANGICYDSGNNSDDIDLDGDNDTCTNGEWFEVVCQSTECVDGSICRANGFEMDRDLNGDLDVCDVGTWKDCTNETAHCPAGYACLSDVCVDVTYPIKPELWWPGPVVDQAQLYVTGWANVTDVDLNITVLYEDNSFTEYGSQPIIFSNNTVSDFTFISASKGDTVFNVPDSGPNFMNFTAGHYIEFNNHNKTGLRRYPIVSRTSGGSGNLLITISERLESNVPIGTVARSYDGPYPSGWFNISVTLQPGENLITARTEKNSNDALVNSRSMTVVYDTLDPWFNLSSIDNTTNNPHIGFVVEDEYDVNLSTLTVTFINGTHDFVFSYDTNISCNGTAGWKNCSIDLDFGEGRYNITFSADDYVDRHNDTFLDDFILDYTADYSNLVNATLEKSTKTISANWTPYYDSLAPLDLYQYAIGVAAYPSTGWDSVMNWTNTTNDNFIEPDLNLIHNVIYYVNVRAKNSAGIFSSVSTSEQLAMIDQTPPSKPTVWDDGNFLAIDNEITGYWNSSDNESGIVSYIVSIGNETAEFGGDNWYNVVNQLSVGSATDFTFSVSLEQNATYYFNVESVNGKGVHSQIGWSNGIQVDITPPEGGILNYSSGDHTSNNIPITLFQGTDNESDILRADLYYARLTLANGLCQGTYFFDTLLQDVTGQTSITANIQNGYCYKFMMRVRNYANRTSDYYYFRDSANETVIVDTTPPTNFGVYDMGVSTANHTNFVSNWDQSYDTQSAIERYWYRVRYKVGGGPYQSFIPWRDNGLSTAIDIDLNETLFLTDGYVYYTEVKAQNGVGVNTTNETDGIIFTDTVPPVTTLLSVGQDDTAPYYDENIGMTYVNVSGEYNMLCKFSENDKNYNQMIPGTDGDCITAGMEAMCPINASSGNNTYHINCRDMTGNGQSQFQNLDVSFEVVVHQPTRHSVNISSEAPIFVEYFNGGSIFAGAASSNETNVTLFEDYTYDVVFKNNASTFSVTLSDVNVTDMPGFNITGRYLNISDFNDSGLNLGATLRYQPLLAYAFKIDGGSYAEPYSVAFNYSKAGISNDYGLAVTKLEYTFGTNTVDVSNNVTYTATRTTSGMAYVSVTNFSAFIFSEDTSTTEICGDSIDNDGDGSTDEGCPITPSGGGGGGDDSPPRRGGGGGSSILGYETCYDGKTNQNETDIDCGGICSYTVKINKSCAENRSCLIGRDCVSGYCYEGSCLVPTCFDGIKNQGEKEVDCGGPCRLCYTDLNDYDEDGMPNDWEIEYGLDIVNATDAGKDPDKDSVTNLQEYVHNSNPYNADSDGDSYLDGAEITAGSDPNDPDSTPGSDVDADTDGDGVKDFSEKRCGMNPDNPNDAESDDDNDGLTNKDECLLYHTKIDNPDSDGDGVTDAIEIAKGTDPNNAGSKPANLFMIILFVIFMLAAAGGGAYYFLVVKKKKEAEEEKARRIVEEEEKRAKEKAKKEKEEHHIPEKFDKKPIEPVKKPDMKRPIKIVLTDEQRFKLLGYINYSLATGASEDTVTKDLKKLGWPIANITELLEETGLTDVVKSLMEMRTYIESELKEKPKDEIRRILEMQGWHKDSIDLALYDVHLLTSQDELYRYLTYMIAEKRTEEDIIHLLMMAGWPEKRVKDAINERKKSVAKELKLIDGLINEFFEQKMTAEDIIATLIEKGYNDDLIKKIMYDKYGAEKNIEKLKSYVNTMLEQNKTIDDIRKVLIKSGWAIDLIDRVIHETFIEMDMHALLELEGTVSALVEKGHGNKAISSELKKKGWADEYIDLVMHKVHIVDGDFTKVKEFIAIRKDKRDSQKNIIELLVKVGWNRKLITELVKK